MLALLRKGLSIAEPADPNECGLLALLEKVLLGASLQSLDAPFETSETMLAERLSVLHAFGGVTGLDLVVKDSGELRPTDWPLEDGEPDNEEDGAPRAPVSVAAAMEAAALKPNDGKAPFQTHGLED